MRNSENKEITFIKTISFTNGLKQNAFCIKLGKVWNYWGKDGRFDIGENVEIMSSAKFDLLKIYQLL